MNKNRRKKIQDTRSKMIIQERNGENIQDYIDSLQEILDEEQDSYDNIPENLLSSMRAEESEDAIDNLEEAIELMENNASEESVENAIQILINI